jgi:hypothetical protein
MSCKLLERYMEAEREIIDEARGGKMELEYYLLTSETDDCDSDGIIKTYGIEIVKKVQGLPSESAGFENIHPDRDRIKKIIGMLADNTVTPISLQDILEDLF